MPKSNATFSTCRVLTLCITLIIICFLIFQDQLLTAITNSHPLAGSSSAPAIPPELFEAQRSPQTFYSFIDQDPSGWATRRLHPNGGYIKLQYNSTFKINFGISMFHSIHCLEMLREKIVGGEATHIHGAGSSDADVEEKDKDPKHLEHCIDYVLQAIMCGGDDTIEPPKITTDDKGYITKAQVVPEGSIHSCRNTNHLYNIVANSAVKALPWVDSKPGDTVVRVFGMPGA